MSAGCRFRSGICVVALAPLLLSCVAPEAAAGGGRALPVHVIHSSLVSGTGGKGFRVTWISDPATLREALNTERPLGMPAGSKPVPLVDFRTDAVLRIEMGMRPTTGYGFDPRALHAVVSAGTATVQVTTLSPGPGAIVSQMITSPCILVRMPRGDYRRVRVVDQQGQVLGVVSVPR